MISCYVLLKIIIWVLHTVFHHHWLHSGLDHSPIKASYVRFRCWRWLIHMLHLLPSILMTQKSSKYTPTTSLLAFFSPVLPIWNGYLTYHDTPFSYNHPFLLHKQSSFIQQYFHTVHPSHSWLSFQPHTPQIPFSSSTTSLPSFSPYVQNTSTLCSARPANSLIIPVLLCTSPFPIQSIYSPQTPHLHYI